MNSGTGTPLHSANQKPGNSENIKHNYTLCFSIHEFNCTTYNHESPIITSSIIHSLHSQLTLTGVQHFLFTRNDKTRGTYKVQIAHIRVKWWKSITRIYHVQLNCLCTVLNAYGIRGRYTKAYANRLHVSLGT